MLKRPNVVIKRKWFGKNKISIVFRKNNISFHDFNRTDSYYSVRDATILLIVAIAFEYPFISDFVRCFLILS